MTMIISKLVIELLILNLIFIFPQNNMHFSIFTQIFAEYVLFYFSYLKKKKNRYSYLQFVQRDVFG